MKKNTALYLILAIIIILGGAYLFSQNSMTSRNGSNPANGTSTDSEVAGTTSPNGANPAINASDSAGKKMSFEAFLGNDKGAYVCSVSQALSDMENKGTVYIEANVDASKRKIRGEYTTIAEGMKVDSTFISRDGFYYSWTSMMPNQGFKMTIKPSVVAGGSVTPGASGDMSGTYSWNAEQVGEYDCKPWTNDESKFAIPTTIKFTEIKS